MRRTIVVATVIASMTVLAGPARAEAPAVAPAATPVASTVTTSAAEEDDNIAERAAYRQKPGITLNNPLGTKSQKFAILGQIHNAIRNTPKGETIRVMSWNIMWMDSVDLLLAAQRRGVKLWILMDEENYSREVPNAPWVKLRRGIAAWNAKVSAPRRSYAKVCKSACRRGNAGAAHAKFFMFTKTGASRNVVIEGGTNLTLASATNQWNEIYAFVDKPDLYKWTFHIFQQMWRDRTPAQPWVKFESANYNLYFSPQVGNYYVGRDPLEMALKGTTCTGDWGRTKIRAAPDVIRGTRGMRVAKLIRALHRGGCDVKIAYTVMGKDIYRYLKASGHARGAVPIKHLVQDFNGDKEFDRYFHLKVWTINGRVDSAAGSGRYWAMNGSTNISDYAAGSDENFAVFKNIAGITKKYQDHIEYWYNNPPRSRPVVPSLIKGPVDPYRNVDLD